MTELRKLLEANGFVTIDEPEGFSTVINKKVIAIENYSFIEGSGWWITGNGDEKMFTTEAEAVARFKEIVGI